jgi:hypothetical protein
MGRAEKNNQIYIFRLRLREMNIITHRLKENIIHMSE